MLIRYKVVKIFFFIVLYFIALPFYIFSINTQEPIIITKKIKTGGYELYVKNNNLYPIQLKIDFPELINLKTDKKYPFVLVIAPTNQKFKFLTLKPIKQESYSYRIMYSYTKGNPYLKHDDSYKYLIPFEHGTKHKCTQGYFGTYSHNIKGLEYAIDLEMKIGTKITAAREGLVVELKKDSNISGKNSSYSKYGNYILIYHNDGTFAKYLHLKQNGTIVKVGQKIKKGQVIGFSGNTGWSVAPHLHFEILKPVVMTLKTIPVRFLSLSNKNIALKEGHYYYAYHPNKKPFKTKFGINLKNTNFQKYIKKIQQNDKIIINEKKIDDTIVFFVKNGYNKNIDVKINFKKYTNLYCSKKIPYITKIKPLTEIFLFILRPLDPAKTWSYSFNYSWSY